MKNTIPAFLLCTVLLACEKETPRIDYIASRDTAFVMPEQVAEDTSRILIADLPFRFDTTGSLIFGIREVQLQERGSISKLGIKSTYGDNSIPSGYHNHNELSGDFVNLIFRDRRGNYSRLSDKQMRITHVAFLRELLEETGRGYLLYTVSEVDSNDNKELDDNDAKSLYVSRSDGSGFRRLTRSLHHVHDWSYVEGERTMFFRTLEDINRDGEFTNKDRMHYYSLDFSTDGINVVEFNPIALLKK